MKIFISLNTIGGMFLESFDLRHERGTKEGDAGL